WHLELQRPYQGAFIGKRGRKRTSGAGKGRQPLQAVDILDGDWDSLQWPEVDASRKQMIGCLRRNPGAVGRPGDVRVKVFFRGGVKFDGLIKKGLRPKLAFAQTSGQSPQGRSNHLITPTASRARPSWLGARRSVCQEFGLRNYRGLCRRP